MKYQIQQRFFGDRHYVWCSPTFEAAALGRYSLGAYQPPSSDPCSIYRQLRDAVSKSDGHEPKIVSQTATLKALAIDQAAAGKITDGNRDEILALLSHAQIVDWRPLIYVVPYHLVEPRVELVPREQRASHVPEYVVRDLGRHEFEIIEPMPWR